MTTGGTFWTSVLREADDFREDWRDTSVKMRRIYQNRKPKGRIKYNLLFANEQNILAALQPDRIEANVLPKNRLAIKSAAVAQATLNWNFREADVIQPVRAMLQHGRIDGVGIVRVGWALPVTPRIQVTAEGEKIVGGKPTMNGAPRTKDREAEILASLQRVFPHHLTGVEMAFVHAIDPLDFLLDPAATRVEFATWVAHRFWLTKPQIEDLYHSGYYDHAECSGEDDLPSTVERWAHLRITGRARSKSPLQQSLALRSQIRRANGIKGEASPFEAIGIWEIHDRTNGEILHIIPGIDRPLRRTPFELDLKQPLYVDFQPTRSLETFWSAADAVQYLDAQRTLDRVVDHVDDIIARAAKAVVLIDKGMSPDDAKNLAKSESGDLVRVDDPSRINALKFGEVPKDLYAYIELLRRIAAEISGVSPTQAGVPSSGGVTATEIASIAQSFSIRMKRMAQDLNSAMARIGRIMLDLQQELLPETTVIRLVGVDAAHWKPDDGEAADGFTTVGRSKIEGEFSLDVMVGAAAEMQQALDRKQTLDRWNLTAAAPESNRIALLEDVHRAFGKDPEPYINRQMMPMAPPGAGGAMGPVGRGPEGAAPGAGVQPEAGTVSPDFKRRTGNPMMSGMLTDATRGGAPRE